MDRLENATEKNYTITEQKAYYRVKIYDKTNEYYGNLYSEAYKGSMVAKITGSLKVGCVVTAETEYVNPEDTLTTNGSIVLTALLLQIFLQLLHLSTLFLLV